MNPTLVSIFGPLQGSAFKVPEHEVSIGREPSNWLALSDPLLSRKHCAIKKDGDIFTICDLQSRNGIFVNGLPTREKVLQHGDQIVIGDSLFLFVLQDADLTSSDIQNDADMFVARSTAQLRVEDALYLRPEKVLSTLTPTARVARDLNALLKISKVINSVQDQKSLEQKLFELIFEVVPAERGAILIAQGTSYVLSKWTGSNQSFSISRTILGKVTQEKVGILGNDLQQSGKFNDSPSLMTSKVHSLLCVPLVAFEEVLAVLYLDTTDPNTFFDKNHLELVTAIASIAAIALKNVQQMEWLIAENTRLQMDININHGMIGESPAIEKVYQFIMKVAPTDSTVLVCGENGTGKELAARALHLNSERKEKLFVAINCAALVETLLESELFGHEKGSFTGAVAQKKGKLEVADGGTLFLDEVSEMSPILQAKLLRVLQEREFERVGGTHPVRVNIRLIAATNKNLENAVSAGEFRQDLYYRLNVVTLKMPPLRDRHEDIPLLATFFATKYSNKFRRPIKGISPEAREVLLHYDWPGNVRELENAMERAVVLGSSDFILQEDLPETLLEVEHTPSVPITKYHEGVKEAKKLLLLKACSEAKGNLNEAAKILGVNLTYLYRLIRNLNLKDTVSGMSIPKM